MGHQPERDTKPPASKLGFDDTAMEVASEPDDVGLDDTALVPPGAAAIMIEPPKPPDAAATTRPAGTLAPVPGPPSDDEAS